MRIAMKSTAIFLGLSLLLIACAPKPVKDETVLLKKYPKCYHQSRKIFDMCVKLNEAGEETTALEIENNGLPK